jgi:hypothetical protein
VVDRASNEGELGAVDPSCHRLPRTEVLGVSRPARASTSM